MKKLFSNFRDFLVEAELSNFDRGGKMDLWRYSTSRKTVDSYQLDPQHFVTNRNAHSMREWQRSRYPRTFFYTDPKNKEAIINGTLYKASVPSSEVYDLKRDPEGYNEKHRHPIYGLRNDMEWTEMLKDIHSSYKGVFYSIGGPDVVAWFEPIDIYSVDKSNQ